MITTYKTIELNNLLLLLDKGKKNFKRDLALMVRLKNVNQTTDIHKILFFTKENFVH